MAKRHWRKQQGKDRFFRRAKEEGYRARSAYKLEGINRKFRILRKGDRVLDIGAAPGSWSQKASEIVGEQGRSTLASTPHNASARSPHVTRSDAEVDPVGGGNG